MQTTSSDSTGDYSLADFAFYCLDEWPMPLVKQWAIWECELERELLEAYNRFCRFLLSCLFNVSNPIIRRRAPLSISGFLARVGKRRKGKI